MSAAVLQPDVVERNERFVSSPTTDAMLAGVEDFLRDPIGYGTYDFDDPITLGDFLTTRHMRGWYISPIS